MAIAGDYSSARRLLPFEEDVRTLLFVPSTIARAQVLSKPYQARQVQDVLFGYGLGDGADD
jgi:hypothetical protein